MNSSNFKSLLENTTGCPVAEYCFYKPPPLPYIVLLTDERARGADDKCFVSQQNITLELYSKKIDRSTEKKLEAMLCSSGTEYSKSRVWIDSEQFFQTSYDFEFTTKL